MDIAALKAKLATANYPTLSDVDAAAALNAEAVAQPDRLVPIAEVMEYLRGNNLWLAIKKAAATSDAAAAAVDLNEDPRAQTIDFNLAVTQGILQQLVAKSLLTQPQADALTALKVVTLPWPVAVLGVPSLTANDVAWARAH